MREIEFRAKSKNNNEWVCGDLIQGENTYISTKEDFYSAVVNLEGHLSTFVKIVNRDTIGQYIGQKDRNGNKIFEGDIFKYKDEYLVIFYEEGEYRFKVYGWYYIIKNHRPDKDKFGEIRTESIQDYMLDNMEVIGNIWDNPELLEENKL